MTGTKRIVCKQLRFVTMQKLYYLLWVTVLLLADKPAVDSIGDSPISLPI